MQDSPRPLYARASALSAAALLAVSGAFIAGPAMANTGDTPATTDAPATAPLETEAATPAETGEASLAPGLEEALQRDLGMTVEEFLAAGELGKKASDALEQLKATEGFISIEILDGGLVITGSGEELQKLATELDATVVEPSAPAVEAPAVDAPVVEAPEEVQEPTEPVTEAPEKTEAETPAQEPTGKDEKELKVASDLRSLVKAFGAEAGTDNLRWISGNAESGFTIAVGEPLDAMKARGMASAMTPEEFAAQYQNVKIDGEVPALKTLADENTIFNGSGYLIPLGPTSASACSVGFTGFNGTGEDAIFSAGHCVDTAGAETVVEIPSAEETFIAGEQLGTFGTYSFDGTAEAPGTDVAVIDGINSELELLPETTQWTTPDELLSATTVKITGTTAPVAGAPVCKSGRTTFWSCGTITESSVIFNAEGTITQGFEAELSADHGDSGGSMISGSLAVGLLSAGIPATEDFPGVVFGADLATAMAVVPDYSIAIHMDAPALTSPENNGTVETDAAITGTAPAGSTVNVTIDGEDAKAETATDGTWSVKAPSLVPEGGTIDVTAQAINGFNKSTISEFKLTVEEAPAAAPAFTTPGTVLRSIETIEGTGVAGATVTLTMPGDAEEEDVAAAADLSTEVDPNGNWSVTLDEPLTYGIYALSATQDGIAGKKKSAAAELTLTVAPDAPVISSPTDGQEFVEGSLPEDITGTGTAGSKVTVAIDDKALDAVVVDEDGTWTVPMGDLAAGGHGVKAFQVINEAASAVDFASIMVTAAPVVVDPTPAGNPNPGTDNGTGTGNGAGTGDLPDTGAANLGLLAGGGAGLLAAGAAALMYNKRRRVAVDA
ncbi:trypsin-like serine protease [Arthrobacter zhaoxinii]|uniref:trypsin-like serine protease n=1 Tax=Arthrobacter zhaoxinii TaxID=2964616 RepID=UPI0021043B60|nr:trypsin-like serine protease [Arthrobacter zhaoxinii]MCQ2000080.1 trypsin-like serine protease [Arthrobacter zhaoxinii]